MRKMSKAMEENELTVMIKRLEWQFNKFISEVYVYRQKILIITKRSYPISPSTPVTVFLIAEKLLSL